MIQHGLGRLRRPVAKGIAPAGNACVGVDANEYIIQGLPGLSAQFAFFPTCIEGNAYQESFNILDDQCFHPFSCLNRWRGQSNPDFSLKEALPRK